VSDRDGTSNRSSASGGLLAVLATLAVISDAVTTAAFVSAGVGNERNTLLVAGLEHGVTGGVLVFVVTQGLLLAAAWLSLGAARRTSQPTSSSRWDSVVASITPSSC